MKKLATIALAALLGVALTASAEDAQARVTTNKDPRCSPRTIGGRYGFKVEGTGPFGSFVALGVQEFDGKGAFTAREWLTIGGVTTTTTMTGTYEVDPDCVGRMTGTFENGFTGTMVFVVTNGGARLLALETDPGATVTVEFERQ